MSDPTTDCQALIGSVLPLAKELLTAQGGFLPFGGAMRPDGQLVSIGAYDGNERSESAEVIALLKGALIAAARNGEYKATALVYDVRVKLPSSGEKSDAIAVSLNHRDDYSVIVLFPYRIDSGRLSLGKPFPQSGEADIFPAR
jgi:hypothetical protein